MGYLCLRNFGVGGDVAVIFFGELGFGLADVFAGHVEGGFGHGCCSGNGTLNGLLNGRIELFL